jgi:hypothetical protein
MPAETAALTGAATLFAPASVGRSAPQPPMAGRVASAAKAAAPKTLVFMRISGSR